MVEERELLILGQQEHEQLLDEEINQLKVLLQSKEKELQHAYSMVKGSGSWPHQQAHSHQQQHHQQQQQQHHHHSRADMDIVERLESLEQEVVQLKRRTPTLAEPK